MKMYKEDQETELKVELTKDIKKEIVAFAKNPTNDFYKHLSGKLLDIFPLTLPNGETLIENLYSYDI